MTTTAPSPYNDDMPTTNARRPSPKAAVSAAVKAAEELVKACEDSLEVARTSLSWVRSAEQVAAEAEARARAGKEPTLLLAQANIAEELGKSRQTIQSQHAEGRLPAPDFQTKTGRYPLWHRETLVHAGVLPPPVGPEEPGSE